MRILEFWILNYGQQPQIAPSLNLYSSPFPGEFSFLSVLLKYLLPLSFEITWTLQKKILKQGGKFCVCFVISLCFVKIERFSFLFPPLFACYISHIFTLTETTIGGNATHAWQPAVWPVHQHHFLPLAHDLYPRRQTPWLWHRRQHCSCHTSTYPQISKLQPFWVMQCSRSYSCVVSPHRRPRTAWQTTCSCHQQ